MAGRKVRLSYAVAQRELQRDGTMYCTRRKDTETTDAEKHEAGPPTTWYSPTYGTKRTENGKTEVETCIHSHSAKTGLDKHI